MSEITCPHCYSEVPRGAQVCRGCQAEIEYGMPPGAILVVLVAAAFCGWKAGAATHSILGWVAFIGLAAGGLYGCARMFADRVSFKRIYRTRR